MLGGYAWLPASGLILLTGLRSLPFGYDVSLHAIVIGFVLSTVFGHALVILPAVARIRAIYTPVLYLPLLLLHLSVALRVASGLAEFQAARMASRPLTILALATFALTLSAARRAAISRHAALTALTRARRTPELTP
ncbi:hypothetical protein JNW90_34485 [Micromonospora sp. STR1s_5]|nr:hypothetical protein [Micromonospora sp. STR1s_5]